MHGLLQFPQRILLGTSNRSNHAGFPPTLLGKNLLSNFHGAHSSKYPKSTMGTSLGFSAISPMYTMFLLIFQAVLRTLNLYVPRPAETTVHIHIVLFVIISRLILVKYITDKNQEEFITALGRLYPTLIYSLYVVNHEFPKGKTIGLRNTTNFEDVIYIWLPIVITAVGFWLRKNAIMHFFFVYNLWSCTKQTNALFSQLHPVICFGEWWFAALIRVICGGKFVCNVMCACEQCFRLRLPGFSKAQN